MFTALAGPDRAAFVAGYAFGARIRHRRRAGLHGLQRIHRGGQDLVLDRDQVQGLLGNGQLVGRHRGHRLPHEHHAVDGEHGMRARGRLLLELRHIRGGEHRAYAGKRFRPGDVDADDPGMRVRAPEELRVQQAAGLEIRHVLDAAGHLLGPVGPGTREADPLDVARGLHHGHDYLPFPAATVPAASVMASSILV